MTNQQHKKTLRLTDEEIFDKVIKNIKRMLVSRGIDMGKVECEKQIVNSFMLRVSYPPRNTTLVVLYCQTTWVMVEETMREQVEKLSAARAKRTEESERNVQLMLVLKNKPPSIDVQGLKCTDHNNILWIETFLEEDFYMDKKEYYINAKSFTRLTPLEMKKVMDKYIRTERNAKIAMNQINEDRRQRKAYISETTAAAMEKEVLPIQSISSFPTISVEDGMARYYDIRLGEMVKIVTNFTGTICVSYQLCVPSQT